MKTRVILITILATILVSCSNELAQNDYNLTSVFKLRQLVQKTETHKYSSASLFFAIGSYRSGETTKTSVKVFAQVEGAYRYLDIPIEDVRVVLVDSIVTPTLQIRYDGAQRADEIVCDLTYLEKKYIITCSEKYLPEKLLPIEIN